MGFLKHNDDLPGLLVSVRSVAEACSALEGGADVIDVKEPERGPLGAADVATIEGVVEVVAGRVPVTSALGELPELVAAARGGSLPRLVAGVSLFKVGLAGCGDLAEWQTNWQRLIGEVSGGASLSSNRPRPAAVVYADWHAAQAPSPGEVLRAGVELGCPALLVDTWNKSGGSLFDCWPMESLADFVAAVGERGLAIVLAGSLTAENVSRAVALGPSLIAVRGAACKAGRQSAVSASRVRMLREVLRERSEG